MSLSREEMMQVMSYADGELEGAALARAEALVGANDEAAQLVRELRTLGDCVRVVEEERKLERAPIDVAGDVMSAIEKSKVVPIGSFAERRRNAFVAGAITAVIAAAAGWFLVVRGNEALPGGSGAVAAQASATPVVTAPVPTTPPEIVAPEQVQAAAGAEGVDIESVESPSHDVSVFYVPAQATANANSNASSVVVWIGEDEAKK